MQVNSLKHLLFPIDNASASLDKSDTAESGSDTIKRARSEQEVPTLQVGSVVLKIGAPVASGVPAELASTPLYTDATKAVSGDQDDDDTAAMAQAHQRAVERNAGNVTQLSVGSDGVIVAKPRTAYGASQPDFVSFAVSAMREFADEAQRTKAVATPTPSEPAAPPAQGHFLGIQKLAAKLHLFA